MPDAGNRLADLLGEETVEKLRQSPLWRAIRDLVNDDDDDDDDDDADGGTSHRNSERERAVSQDNMTIRMHDMDELFAYIRSEVGVIVADAKVFPQLQSIISNAAKMARASYHWERHIGRTRHSAQLRRLVTLSDSLSQVVALLDGVDLDDEQLVSVADEEVSAEPGTDPTTIVYYAEGEQEAALKFGNIYQLLKEADAILKPLLDAGFMQREHDLKRVRVRLLDAMSTINPDLSHNGEHHG